MLFVNQKFKSDLERVVMNSIRCAQNISQSFSHSIQLGEEEAPSNPADVDSALPARITAFLEHIGKYVFPQVHPPYFSSCAVIFSGLKDLDTSAISLPMLLDQTVK